MNNEQTTFYTNILLNYLELPKSSPFSLMDEDIMELGDVQDKHSLFKTFYGFKKGRKENIALHLNHHLYFCFNTYQEIKFIRISDAYLPYLKKIKNLEILCQLQNCPVSVKKLKDEDSIQQIHLCINIPDVKKQVFLSIKEQMDFKDELVGKYGVKTNYSYAPYIKINQKLITKIKPLLEEQEIISQVQNKITHHIKRKKPIL